MRCQPPPLGRPRPPPHRSQKPPHPPPPPPRPSPLPPFLRTLPQLGPLPASQGHALAAGEPAAAPTTTAQGLGATDWEAVLLRRTMARQQQQQQQRRQQVKGLQARLQEERDVQRTTRQRGRGPAAGGWPAAFSTSSGAWVAVVEGPGGFGGKDDRWERTLSVAGTKYVQSSRCLASNRALQYSEFGLQSLGGACVLRPGLRSCAAANGFLLLGGAVASLAAAAAGHCILRSRLALPASSGWRWSRGCC